MREGDLDGQSSFGGTNVDERSIFLPGKLLGYRFGGAHADACHGAHELLETGRVLIQDAEEIAAGLDLVLRLAGPQALGQRSPEVIKTRVGHLEDATDVGGLGAIQEELCLGRIGIERAVAVEHAQGHKGVEEVSRAAWMETQALPERLKVERLLGELRKNAEFDGAQQGLGAPEAEAELHDVVRCKFVTHGCSLSGVLHREYKEATTGALSGLRREYYSRAGVRADEISSTQHPAQASGASFCGE